MVLAKVATDEGIKSACTMYINNAYGQGLSQIFTDNFEKAGGKVTAQVPHESEQATYASELDKCTAGNPEALVAPAYPQSARVFLREAVEAGKVKKFLFTDGTQSADMFTTLGWATFDGMKGTAATSLDVAAGTAFETAYAAKYGSVPALPYLREAYDAVYLIALAAEKAGSTDSTAIRDALRDVANPPGEVVSPGTDGFKAALKLIADGKDINYEGASGPVDLDKNGDVLIGAIEVWHVDAATQKLVTDTVYKVDLQTGQITKVNKPGSPQARPAGPEHKKLAVYQGVSPRERPLILFHLALSSRETIRLVPPAAAARQAGPWHGAPPKSRPAAPPAAGPVA